MGFVSPERPRLRLQDEDTFPYWSTTILGLWFGREGEKRKSKIKSQKSKVDTRHVEGAR